MHQGMYQQQFNTTFSQQGQWSAPSFAHATMRQSSATGNQQQPVTLFSKAACDFSDTSGFFYPCSFVPSMFICG